MTYAAARNDSKVFFRLYPNWPVSAVFNKGVEISQIHLEKTCHTSSARDVHQDDGAGI